MANRNFSEYGLSLEKRVVHLFAHVTFGASGAPTLDTANSKGIASISRTSAGLFVITLADVYYKLLNVAGTFTVAAGSFPAAPVIQHCTNTVSTDGKITVQFSGPTNATTTTLLATDPANGEKIHMTITLGDSSAF